MEGLYWYISSHKYYERIFFVKVQIGITDEIESLIDMHQEGAYWDFKREWYGNNKDGDMLIDIICMANKSCK